MKLKYYLRGVGIGIIFATLVMTVSSFVHKNNISDEYIIKEARKLGMVMKEELKDDENLWGSDDTEDTESTQVVSSEVDTSESESTSQSESESQSTPEPTPEPEPTPQPEPTPEPQAPVVPDEPTSESEKPAYATITIVRGDYARQVGQKLFEAGLVDDAEAFRVYMGEHGYAKSIRAGIYNIPIGSTYEEICKIVAG